MTVFEKPLSFLQFVTGFCALKCSLRTASTQTENMWNKFPNMVGNIEICSFSMQPGRVWNEEEIKDYSEPVSRHYQVQEPFFSKEHASKEDQVFLLTHVLSSTWDCLWTYLNLHGFKFKRGIVSLPCYDLIQPSEVNFCDNVTINFYSITKIYVTASYDSESLNNIFLIPQK